MEDLKHIDIDLKITGFYVQLGSKKHKISSYKDFA